MKSLAKFLKSFNIDTTYNISKGGINKTTQITKRPAAPSAGRIPQKVLVEKVKKYEDFLHALQMNAEVTMDNDAMKKLIGNACRWSYAHRVGNGEYTEEEQNEAVKKAFDKLTDV